MIGSIPSFIDQQNELSDTHLYPQQLTPMYAQPYNQQTNDYPGIPRSTYGINSSGQPQYQGFSIGVDEQASDIFAQDPTDFRQGSFADVGAAFGFDPDHPIQISSTNLPQSSASHFDFPNGQQLITPLPLTNLGQPSSDVYMNSNWHGHSRSPSFGSHQGKRQRRSQELSDDDEPNEFLESRRPRLPGACVHCKNLKVKCEFGPGQDTCNRCKSGRKDCVVMGRKPRRAPPKREELLNRIREQEATIKELQAKLDAFSISSPDGHESALSPTSVALQPPSPRVARVKDKDIQEWIDKARESANVTGDLAPSAVSRVDEHERLSTQEDSDDDVEDNFLLGKEASPEPLLRPSDVDETTRSPAVGTALSPIGLIASSALRKKRGGRRGSTTSASADGDRDEVGVANASFFRPGMSTNPELRWSVRESQPPPRILASSLISPREVDKLFEIFFDRMNLSVSLLDPKIYTAQTTYWRSPFLFTVICAIASRYLVEREGLYPVLMNYAKMEAGQALVAGLKSPELVAGYILLSLYPVPSARWEEDRGWLMLGVAIRMATDLNLHHSMTAKITNEQQAREVANRTRIWINCYNLDRSTSTQFGKPSTIKEDFIARHSKFWYKGSGFNYDIHLNGYTQLLRVMARFHEAIYSDPDTPTGLNKTIDFEAVTKKYEQELLDHWSEWEPRFQAESDSSSLHCLYRIELLRLANAYSRLVILSFRFQNAFHNGLSRGDPFLQRCIDTASSVIKVVVENMAPHPFLRTAPDAQFVFASFASVFLLKLLRPRFATVLEPQQQQDIMALVQRLIDVLRSGEVAIDERHTPKLYARFLAGLLERHTSSHRSSRGSEQPEEPTEFAVTIEQPQTVVIEVPAHPVYTPPIVTPPSPRNLPAPAIHDGASSVSDTIAARSYASSVPTVPDTMTGDVHIRDDDMLATMRAISNPTFWDDMMMPGFSWTPLETSTPELFQQYAST